MRAAGNGNERAATISSLIYLGCRAIYPFMYYLDLSTLRSIVWVISQLAIFALFIIPFAS